MESDAGDVGLHALVLDDAAVVDQQDAIRVQFSGGSFPLHLQAVGAAFIRNLQLGDLSRSWEEPSGRQREGKKKLYQLLFSWLSTS